MANDYSAKDIEVLEGLEPVRKRPGMYIGGTDSAGLHHLVWEALDNAVDEAINGHCNAIEVIIGDDGSVSVEDNGRGIPVDKHPKFKKPALEIIMTTLHSGAKFSQKSYSTSGGLHGVGVSVVNALSECMTVEVKRDGHEWSQSFAKGLPLAKLKKGRAVRKRGTKITFTPDASIFKKTVIFSKKLISDRAETEAFLNSGVTIVVKDERDGSTQTFHYKNGIRDYLTKLISTKKAVGAGYFYHTQENGARVEVALQWTEGTETKIYSYANSVYTSDGGAHENGLRNALTKTVRAHIERTSGKGKPVSITSDDVREGLIAVLSVFIGNPQFQGQTKEKLNNPEVISIVESAIKTAFERYLLENPSTAEAIVGRIKLASQARMASRAAKDTVMRKTSLSHRLTLPGKLADCSSTNPSNTELFIVEGDSAGGSSKQARDRTRQAILPLRGKILNVENATAEKLAANNEIKALVTSIGAGVGDVFDYSKLRYDKIIIMTDADVDGAHISALLLTFFYRYMPKLINRGHIYLAQPPLFRVELGKDSKYALDENGMNEILQKAPKNVKPVIHRYKGLGEMPASVLKETTMDVSKRVLLKVTIDDVEATDSAFTRLMGKDASARYDFLKENSAAFVSSGGELDF
ncbi:Topoisomerase IV subunit B [hydrothermal vent metagenome]|uniref:DNA topoisomerase (ATP-hydrolyzing) n=1 Tax=hydrothermal vent metagenome TaxID=652676 RepID=A0A3B1C511_9ZZZZ